MRHKNCFNMMFGIVRVRQRIAVMIEMNISTYFADYLVIELRCSGNPRISSWARIYFFI